MPHAGAARRGQDPQPGRLRGGGGEAGYIHVCTYTATISIMQGPIWIKTIECWGNESSLALCPGAVWEHNYYCQHSEDVGLECLLTQDSDTGSQGGGEVGDT